jgi:hypothetical protein
MSKVLRSISLGSAMVGACAAISLIPAPAAHAEVRCNSNGTPGLTSGKFHNNSTREFKVTGDRRRADGSFENVSVFVYPGEEAYATHRICDADFFYNYFRTWIYDGQAYMPTAPYTSTKIGPGVTECHDEGVRDGGTVTQEPFCKH